MEKLKFLSYITVGITLVSIIYSLSSLFTTLKFDPNTTVAQIKNVSPKESTADDTSALARIRKSVAEEIAKSNHGVNDSIAKEEPVPFTTITIPAATKPGDFTVQKFWLKVGFSSIFFLSALYVILSNKYDESTKKWAFSVLTLIAGVWIGSISG